jgi:hypothetical protein
MMAGTFEVLARGRAWPLDEVNLPIQSHSFCDAAFGEFAKHATFFVISIANPNDPTGRPGQASAAEMLQT